jgi:hypothetical protein
MPKASAHPEAPAAIQTHLTAIFVSLEPLAKLNVIYGKVVEIYMVGLLVFKSDVQQ